MLCAPAALRHPPSPDIHCSYIAALQPKQIEQPASRGLASIAGLGHRPSLSSRYTVCSPFALLHALTCAHYCRHWTLACLMWRCGRHGGMFACCWLSTLIASPQMARRAAFAPLLVLDAPTLRNHAEVSWRGATLSLFLIGSRRLDECARRSGFHNHCALFGSSTGCGRRRG